MITNAIFLPHSDICQYRGLTKFTVKTHMGRAHNEKKFKCRLGCGKAFSHKNSEVVHALRYCHLSIKKSEMESALEKSNQCKAVAYLLMDNFQ